MAIHLPRPVVCRFRNGPAKTARVPKATNKGEPIYGTDDTYWALGLDTMFDKLYWEAHSTCSFYCLLLALLVTPGLDKLQITNVKWMRQIMGF